MRTFPNHKRDHKLFDLGYKHTDRMKELIEGTRGVTRGDWLELFEVALQGHRDAVGFDNEIPPSLIEFCAWIIGNRIKEDETQWFEDLTPSEVVW